MFAYANLQLYLLDHRNVHSDRDRKLILRELAEQPHERPGLYVSAVAEEILGQDAPDFFAAVEQDTRHIQLFARQMQESDKIVVISEGQEGGS